MIMMFTVSSQSFEFSISVTAIMSLFPLFHLIQIGEQVPTNLGIPDIAGGHQYNRFYAPLQVTGFTIIFFY